MHRKWLYPGLTALVLAVTRFQPGILLPVEIRSGHTRQAIHHHNRLETAHSHSRATGS